MQTIVLPLCRKRFTYPRVGYVKHPGRADRKSLIVGDIALPLLVVALIICVGIWATRLLPACLGIFLAGLAFASARMTGYILDYILAGVLLASGLVGLSLIWLGHDPGTSTAYQLWGLSGILVPVGLVQLILFLRKYPEPVKDVSDDSEN